MPPQDSALVLPILGERAGFRAIYLNTVLDRSQPPTGGRLPRSAFIPLRRTSETLDRRG